MILRATPLLMLSAVALGASACGSIESHAPPPETVCQDPRLPPPKDGACRAQAVSVLNRGAVNTGTIVRIAQGYVFDGDAGRLRFIYFLYPPSGDNPVPLGEFRQAWNVRAEFQVFDGLGMEPSNMGGAARLDMQVFYDKLIEQADEGWCVLYRLKHPFRGVMRDCTGRGRPQGEIGYVAGVRSMEESRRVVCEWVARDTGLRCGQGGLDHLYDLVRREDDGTLYYIQILRRRATGTPVAFEYFTYRVPAMSGDPELLQATSDDPLKQFQHGRRPDVFN